jgi:glycosyltransferase involved in cell wall biosynthesis
MKKPVLATNVGGIPELMKNKETGFLIEKGDHTEWIDKISLLLNDEKTRRQMGSVGRKFVEENFSWNIIAKKFVNDIKKMI